MGLKVGEALKGAFKDFGAHWTTLLGASFLFAVLAGLAVTLLSVAAATVLGLTAALPPAAGVATILGWIAGWALAISGGVSFFWLGFIGLCLQVQKGQTPSVRALFAQGSRFMPGWIAGFLVTAASMTAGTACAAVPLVGGPLGVVVGITLSVLTCLTPFFIVDRNQAALTAIRSSVRAASRHWIDLAVLLLACGLLTSLLSLIPLVGSLIGLSLSTLALTHAYARVGRRLVC